MMENYSLDTVESLNEVIDMLRWSREESEEHEKLALKCIQKAQFFKDIDTEFNARMAYVSVVTWLGKNGHAVTMFPWLLKKCDEDRERFDYFSTLWAYKWVISDIKDFANIPLPRLEALYSDMEKRFRDYGAGDKVIHYFRFQYYDCIGRPDKADEEYKLYRSCNGQSSVLEDCSACQPSNSIPHLLYRKKYKEVFKLAEPIIKGRMSCRSVPETTYPKLLFAAMMLQDWKESEHYGLLAKKHLKADKANLDSAAYLLYYYAIREDFVKGRNLLEKQFPFLLKASDRMRFNFTLAVVVFFGKFMDRNKKKLKMKLPAGSELYNETGEYRTEDILTYFSGTLNMAADALDQRNGNDHYKQLIVATREAVKSADSAFPRE